VNTLTTIRTQGISSASYRSANTADDHLSLNAAVTPEQADVRRQAEVRNEGDYSASQRAQSALIRPGSKPAASRPVRTLRSQ
jgi:hypothetical protein